MKSKELSPFKWPARTLARFQGGGGSERRVVALATAAARLMRAYSAQVETLRRLRHGGDQYVRVEHVHVNEGGQAVIGNVKTAGGDAAQGPAPTPHANDPVVSSAAYAPEPKRFRKSRSRRDFWPVQWVNS